MSALPEFSILHLAITEANNAEIYPNPTGTLIIENIYTSGATFRFYAKVEDVPRIWEGLFTDNTFSGWSKLYSELDPPSGIGGGSKLQVYPQDLIAGTEGQTEFEITLSTFDPTKDTVLVQKGMLWLNPNGDYTIQDNKVVLTRGTTAGQTIGIWVWKNVPVIEEEETISGAMIAPGSIPMDALAEDVVQALDDVKKSVSDGKELVANAITAKGVSTAVDAEFEVMATNIASIETLDSAPKLEATTYTPTTSNIVIGSGKYLIGDQTIVGDSNLVAGNIAKGKSIFGVTGTYDPSPNFNKK